MKLYEEALITINETLDMDNSILKSLYLKGKVLNKLAKYQEALMVIEEFVYSNPKSADVYRQRALSLYNLDS